MNKQKEEMKNASLKTKTPTEIEYERYRQQTKLEKMHKIQREKYKQYLIQKETYADSIYAFFCKRKLFLKMKMYMKINEVKKQYVLNLKNKIRLWSVYEDIKVAYDIRKEKEIKKEQMKMITSSNFYNLKLLYKSFMSIKVIVCVHKVVLMKMEKKRKKNIFKEMKKFVKENQQRNKDIVVECRMNRVMFLKKGFITMMKGLVKSKKEEKAKEEIVNRLKNKAKILLGDYNI